MELAFRETQLSDIEDLFRIRARTRENPISKEQLARVGITPASTAASMNAGVVKGRVYVHEGKVVGFCSGEVTTGEVLVLAVLPDYEAKGIGKRLLAQVVAELRLRGAPRVWLAASANPKDRAHGFYRAQGWRPTGGKDANGDEILTLEMNDDQQIAEFRAVSD